MTAFKRKFLTLLAGFCLIFLMPFGLSWLRAATLDVEKDNDLIVLTPTPDEDEAVDVETAPSDGDVAGDLSTKQDDSEDRVGGLSDVTFDYFLTSGYAANDISAIPAVGKVDGTPEIDGSLSTAKRVYVTVTNDKVKLIPGEKLIVFGNGGRLHESRSGFDKIFIKNLAILRVREMAGKRYLTDVVTSYDFIPPGSHVKLYDGEKNLWEKAQVAKELPTHLIKCYVAGGERGRDAWNQTDYLILTAGTKQGVVEGLTFQLNEIQIDNDNKVQRVARGFAKVFYAGSNYCLVKIQNGSDSISKGFEAIYKP